MHRIAICLGRLSLILVISLSTGLSVAETEASFFNDCKIGFAHLFRRFVSPLKSMSKSLETDAFAKLQAGNRFLQQDASYLPLEICGGTCASVSYVNNMLVMRETLHPGSISKLSRAALRRLHVKSLRGFIDGLARHHQRDGTRGAYLNEFDAIYSEVYRKVFNAELPSSISVIESSPAHFQSLSPGDGSLVIAAVETEKGTHAVVVTEVSEIGRKRSRTDVFPEEFKVKISDPHNPSQFLERNVYESGGSLLVEGYGDSKPKPVTVYDKTFFVRAGRINAATTINFRTFEASRQWTKEAVAEVAGKDGVRADLYLKNGVKLQDVMVLPSFIQDRVVFYHRFIMSDQVLISEIADIQVIKESD